VKELGRGGYGIVHLAEDLEIPGRVVAVKTVRPGPIMPDAESLRHEASVLAALQHPSILVVHEVGEGPSGIFLAAEFMPGGSVSDRLERGPLSEAEALALARSAADALAAAHEAGLVHRDFKPGNLLLSADGLAKVADFGIATKETKAAAAAAATIPSPPPGTPLDATLTATVVNDQVIVGTPAYMPPELFAGIPWSARGDQFSFGIVLHEMLTREHPYDLRQGIVATRLDPVISRKLPADLDRIVRRCLARDPAARFPDMRAVVAALDEAILRRSPERKRTWRVALAGIAVVAVLLLSWTAWRVAHQRRAHKLNEAGAAALKRGDHDAARAAFVAAHSADPGNLAPCTNLGFLAADEASPTWAVTILRDCAKGFPDSAPVRYTLGAVLAKSSEPARAVTELTEALKLVGSSELRPYVVNELALAYLAVGKSSDAIRLVGAERPDPSASAEGALLTRTLGLAYLDAGRAEEAERALTAALPKLPADKRPAALVALGRAQEARGLKEDAVKSYSQALVEGATGADADAARAALARIVPA
jgi:tetratricopeptide (TPR) repeat protein